MFEKEPDLLTRRQCQRLLQISKSKMLEFIREGYIPARKIAGSFRIEKSDLIEFIEIPFIGTDHYVACMAAKKTAEPFPDRSCRFSSENI